MPLEETRSPNEILREMTVDEQERQRDPFLSAEYRVSQDRDQDKVDFARAQELEAAQESPAAKNIRYGKGGLSDETMVWIEEELHPLLERVLGGPKTEERDEWMAEIIKTLKTPSLKEPPKSSTNAVDAREKE